MKIFFLILINLSILLSTSSIDDIQIKYDNGEYLEAKELLTGLSDESEDIHFLSYQIFYKLDDLNKANEFLQKCIDVNDSENYSKEADFLSELINDLKNTNKTLTSGYVDDAILEISNLTNKYPNNAIIFYRLGYAYKQKEDYDNAINNFRKASLMNPFNNLYKEEIKTISNIEILKGKEYYDIKEYQEALSHFNKALEYDPENYAAMFRMGNIYFAIRDYVKASEFLEQGLFYQSNNYKVLYMLGRCYSALNDDEKALSSYDKALSINPNYDKAILEKSKIYKNNGNFTEAKDLLHQILENSSNSKAYELLIDIEIKLENYDDAITIGEEGIGKNPNSHTILARVASLYNIKGNHEKAKIYCKQSLKSKKNYAPASFELGIAELNLCNKLAAKDAFNVSKRDRNYRKASSDYLKQENFDYYTRDCN